jgi:hypothetical protein
MWTPGAMVVVSGRSRQRIGQRKSDRKHLYVRHMVSRASSSPSTPIKSQEFVVISSLVVYVQNGMKLKVNNIERDNACAHRARRRQEVKVAVGDIVWFRNVALERDGAMPWTSLI